MGWFSDFVSNPVGTIADTASNAIETVGNLGQTVIDTVKEHPLEAAALAAAGYYFAPQIGAWMNPATGEALTGTATGVAAGTAPTTAAALTGYDAAMADLASSAPAIGAGAAGAGLGAATGAGLGAAGASALGAAGGSTLASMLPYMTAAQIGSGLLQANAATKAADIQAAAADKALAQQQANFNLINAQQAPYRGAGYGALNQLAQMGSGQTQMYDETGKPMGAVSGATDYLTHQFDATDLAKGLAPNYDFMLQQGQMANQRAANVGGGALSGNTLQGLQKFTQDYAGNAYQNAFNNYQNQRQNIYNTLAGIAGIGQTGQNAANTAGTNLANAASQLGVGSAGAQAAGQVGQTNALANTANNVIGNYTLASLLNQRGNVA